MPSKIFLLMSSEFYLPNRCDRFCQSGRLSRIVSVHAQFWLLKPDDYFDLNWRKQLGAGPTHINLIHDIDLLRHFCGEIVSAQVKETQEIREFEVEDTNVVILEFPNGALGTVSISDTIAAPWSWELAVGDNPVYPKADIPYYRAGGTKGLLSIPDMYLWDHPGKQSWWEPIKSKKLSFQPADPVKEQLLHFIDVIRNGEAPLVSGLEGRCCTTLIIEDSHYESMRLDRLHEQAITRPLPHDELVQLHCVASQARVTADLAGSGHDVARAACWPLWPPCRVL